MIRSKPVCRIGMMIAALVIFCAAFSVGAGAADIGLDAQLSSSARVGGTMSVTVGVNDRLRGAKFEITCDETALRYEGVTVVTKGGSALGRADSGRITVVYVSDAPANGSLLKLRFSPLKACDATLTIRLYETVSPDTALHSLDESVSLRVSITASSGRSSSSSAKSRSATTSQYDDDSDTFVSGVGGRRTLLPDSTASLLRTALFSGAVVALALVVLVIGIMIGRRVRRSVPNDPASATPPADNPCGAPPEFNEEPYN